MRSAVTIAAIVLIAPPPLTSPRVVPTAPFPGLSPVMIDDRLASVGIGNSLAKLAKAQARILWVDGTANMAAVNTPEKVDALVSRAAKAGFNVIIYDVKPISGYTMYPSSLTDQITSWRDGRFDPGYDPIPPFLKACRREGLELHLALNAFSEGHRVLVEKPGEIKASPSSPGWGYSRPDLQTYQYVPKPVWAVSPSLRLDLDPTPNPKAFTLPSVFLDQAPLPKAAFYVTVNSSGVVAKASGEPATAPAGGSVICLPQSAPLDEVKRWVWPGRRIFIDSSPRFVPISDAQTQLPLMMNPHLPENQLRALSFVEEVLGRYAVDGVVYDDRLRYGGLNADFSPQTIRQFEAHVQRRLRWPDDVYKFTYTHRLNRTQAGRPYTAILPGPYFDEWLAWRAETMAAFMTRVRNLVDRIRPGARLGVYAGSWYGDYAQYGSNYGSPSLDAGFAFLTPSYRRTGFATKLDFLITGCYYPVPTMLQAQQKGLPVGQTVEAGGIVSSRVVRDKTWTYAGIMLSDYFSEPGNLADALQAAAATTQGVMVFDYSHQIDRFWPVFEKAFSARVKPPHSIPGLTQKMRSRREEWDRKGYPDAPFPILEGAPGAGF